MLLEALLLCSMQSLSLSLISAELDFAEELLETVLAQPFRQK
jgi:hypothetical protein